MNANKEAKELLGMTPDALEDYIADELSAIDTTGDRKRSAYLGMALRVLREIKDGGVRDAKELATAFSKVASDLIERAAPMVAATEVEAEESFWNSIAEDVPKKSVAAKDQTFLGAVEARAKHLELDPVDHQVAINEKAKELAKQVLQEVPGQAAKPVRGESAQSPGYKREKRRYEKASKYFDCRRRGMSREDSAKLAKIAISTAMNYDHAGPAGYRVQPRYVNHENINIRIPPMNTDKWPPRDVVDRCILDRAEAEKRQARKTKAKSRL